VKARFCPHETDIWNAIAEGRWPEATDADLQAHVESCQMCHDLALVASGLNIEGAAARHESAPPSSAIVWWRAQMRARQEAAAAADRPISVVHSLAIACAAGLVLGLLGTVAAWVRGSAGWLGGLGLSASSVTAQLVAWDLTSRWVIVPALLIIAIMPIAFYAIVADE
jgi:hypothetical protein